uniref:Uncharacterized protein n=1 Tax=Anguilla anguilla TaxID=7936 RepID=A0A0E9U0J1_ANGAN
MLNIRPHFRPYTLQYSKKQTPKHQKYFPSFIDDFKKDLIQFGYYKFIL